MVFELGPRAHRAVGMTVHKVLSRCLQKWSVNSTLSGLNIHTPPSFCARSAYRSWLGCQWWSPANPRQRWTLSKTAEIAVPSIVSYGAKSALESVVPAHRNGAGGIGSLRSANGCTNVDRDGINPRCACGNPANDGYRTLKTFHVSTTSIHVYSEVPFCLDRPVRG